MATTLKVDKLLEKLDPEEIKAAIAARKAELALLEETLAFRERLGGLVGKIANGNQRPGRRAAGGTTADLAHAWLLEHGPADAVAVGKGIGKTRGCVYQAMRKGSDRFKLTPKGWTAKK